MIPLAVSLCCDVRPTPHNCGVRKTDRERFDGRIRKNGSCSEWVGARDRNGYGRFVINGRTFVASRWQYEQHHGALAAGLVVMHKCDHPWCVNIEHLILGTVGDNNADMRAKGRDRAFGGEHYGETHGNARLTASHIRAIRRAAARGVMQKVLAARYGVTRGYVSHVVRGTRWKKGA